MRQIGPLLIPIALVALALAVVLPTAVQTESRIRQHLLSLGMQILAAGVAAILLWPTRNAQGAHDRERRTWRQLSFGSFLWAIGLLVYGIIEWMGPGLSSPSIADVVLVGASLVLADGLFRELRLVRPRLTTLEALLIAGLATGIAVGTFAVLFKSIIVTPADFMETSFNLAYPAMAILLVTLAGASTMALRGSLSGQVWLGVTLAFACLAISMTGFVVLASLGLYSDIHPINLLRVAGFALLAGTGVWRRQALPAIIAEAALTPRAEPRAPRSRQTRARLRWRPWAFAQRPQQPTQALQVEPRRIEQPTRPPEAIRQPRVAREPHRRHRSLGLAGLLLMIFLLGGALGASGVWVAITRVRESGVPQIAPDSQATPVPQAAPIPQAPSLPIPPQATGQFQETPTAPPQVSAPPAQTPQAATDPSEGQSQQTESPLPSTQSAVDTGQYGTAAQLMSQGRFQEAQDEYLAILLSLGAPNDEIAMKGIVMARRRLANDDPALLRRQAASYLRAKASGDETSQHYTRRALEVLARASLAAAREIEAARLHRP